MSRPPFLARPWRRRKAHRLRIPLLPARYHPAVPVGWTTGELAGVAIDQKQNIVNQIRELGVKSIFVETTINRELLEDIAREAGVSVGGELYSDAMGPVGTAGESYIGMMRENVLTIVEHLK